MVNPHPSGILSNEGLAVAWGVEVGLVVDVGAVEAGVGLIAAFKVVNEAGPKVEVKVL